MTDAGRQVLIIAIVITEKQRGRKSSMIHVVYQYKLNIDKDGYMWKYAQISMHIYLIALSVERF